MKIGIDIGGSHIGIALVNEYGKIIEKSEADIENMENVENFIESRIVKFVEANGEIGKGVNNLSDIEMIGIAAPGIPRDGKIFSMCNLGIKELDVSAMLRKHYNLPIRIRNDGKCAALAEKKYGSLKEYDDCVFLCLGTGIGAGVFLQGKLLKASRAPGFEIGHLVIEKDGIQCKCGKKGCFETYCSMKRFKDNVKKLANLPDEISSIELLDYLKKHQDEKKFAKLIDEYIDNLIIGFSNLIDIFEPEAIALGGSFVHFKDVFFEKLQKKFYNEKYAFNSEFMPELKLAVLGNDAGIIGATIEE